LLKIAFNEELAYCVLNIVALVQLELRELIFTLSYYAKRQEGKL